MTAKQLAEVCGTITINLMKGGVPLELAMLGVRVKLDESMTQHKGLAEDKYYGTIADDLKEEFSFCLQD